MAVVRSTIIVRVNNSLGGARTAGLGVEGTDGVSIWKCCAGDIHAVRAGPLVVIASKISARMNR